MIRICTAKENGRIRLVCEGHSGYSGTGTDIVCAGVSALTQAFALACEDNLIEHESHGDGYLEICLVSNETVEAMYDMMMTGLKAISAGYPRYLAVMEY